MKILISIYHEDIESGSAVPIYSRLLATGLSLKEIEDRLHLHEGFRYSFTFGHTLSFLDIYYYFDVNHDVISTIENFPVSNVCSVQAKTPAFLLAKEYDPGIADHIDGPNEKRNFLYSLNRHECGASGYSAVVYWMAEHPFEMIFIAGIIYDIAKFFVLKIFNRLFGREIQAKKPQFIALNIKSFYKNFETVTKVKASDCQIVKMKRMKNGQFNIVVRTIDNIQYIAVAAVSGKLEKVELKEKVKT